MPLAYQRSQCYYGLSLDSVRVPDKNSLPDAPTNDVRLWKEAYDELSQKIKDSLPKDPPDSILDLQHLAQQKVEEARRGRLKVKIKDGKNLVLRDAFEKMAHWIARFVQVGDTVVQYDPGHAALPWAAVRFILTVGDKQCDLCYN